MIPIYDDNPQHRTPIVTYALIAANFTVWLFLQNAGFGAEFEHSICKYGFIPAQFLGSQLPTDCPFQGSLSTLNLLNSIFMHGGWMHILGNMLFLWIFGGNIEDAMGRSRFIVFYLTCGFAASFAQLLANPNSIIPMVGASGAIGGLMGAYIILFPRAQVKVLVPIFFIFTVVAVPSFVMLGIWFALQLFDGLNAIGASSSGGVAFWAHVGGFVVGAAGVYLFKDDELLADHPHAKWSKKPMARDVWDDPKNRQKRR
jgi:membrane associated rhomboid family serine protease